MHEGDRNSWPSTAAYYNINLKLYYLAGIGS